MVGLVADVDDLGEDIALDVADEVVDGAVPLRLGHVERQLQVARDLRVVDQAVVRKARDLDKDAVVEGIQDLDPVDGV